MPEEDRITGTSLESFARAADEAFAQIEADSDREVGARVTELWMTKGGFVGRTQYHAALERMKEGD